MVLDQNGFYGEIGLGPGGRRGWRGGGEHNLISNLKRASQIYAENEKIRYLKLFNLCKALQRNFE
jgi:hypothetical protein